MIDRDAEQVYRIFRARRRPAQSTTRLGREVRVAGAIAYGFGVGADIAIAVWVGLATLILAEDVVAPVLKATGRLLVATARLAYGVLRIGARTVREIFARWGFR